ncbi:MAG: GatB/YqeY domain-containing protein [Nitrospirota bacterium]
MMLQERLQQEIKEAMKHGHKEKVEVMRMLKSDIKYKEISRGKDYRLSEEEIIEVITSGIKKRKYAAEQFSMGRRSELADKEMREIVILETFLPERLELEEIDMMIKSVIEEVGADNIRDMGKVMKVLMPQLKGRADGSYVSKRVNELLKG